MKDITTVGEILIDLTQCGVNENNIPLFSANPGGAPANVAVAASRLGANTAFIGKVGNDCYGDFLKKTLTDNNVDTTSVVTDSISNTTLAVVSLTQKGERSFAFYRKNCADTLLCEEEISNELLNDTHFLHFGSVSLTTEPSRTATLSAVKRAKKAGATITYDPNYRESLWDSEQNAVAQMKSAIKYADILKISDEELPLLTGMLSLENGTQQIFDEYGTKLILVTLGADGAFYRLGSKTGKVAGCDVKVADTNGAGDTFFGAVLAGLADKKIYAPQTLKTEQLEKIIEFANTAAALTTSKSGAIPAMPTIDEVKTKLEIGGN